MPSYVNNFPKISNVALSAHTKSNKPTHQDLSAWPTSRGLIALHKATFVVLTRLSSDLDRNTSIPTVSLFLSKSRCTTRIACADSGMNSTSFQSWWCTPIILAFRKLKKSHGQSGQYKKTLSQTHNNNNKVTIPTFFCPAYHYSLMSSRHSLLRMRAQLKWRRGSE